MFKIDDKVEWTSQSQGYQKKKSGRIMAIVPAGSAPASYGYIPNGGPIGLPRKHESYVIRVGSRTYWPRVSQLKKANKRGVAKSG